MHISDSSFRFFLKGKNFLVRISFIMLTLLRKIPHLYKKKLFYAHFYTRFSYKTTFICCDSFLTHWILTCAIECSFLCSKNAAITKTWTELQNSVFWDTSLDTLSIGIMKNWWNVMNLSSRWIHFMLQFTWLPYFVKNCVHEFKKIV